MGVLGRFREYQHTTFGNLAILLFLCAQAADGVFTYLGVHSFGRMIEGNPLLSYFIHLFGAGPALAAAKLAAASCGSILHLLTVHRIVAVLTGLYFAAAVVPWVYVLFLSPMRQFGF